MEFLRGEIENEFAIFVVSQCYTDRWKVIEYILPALLVVILNSVPYIGPDILNFASVSEASTLHFFPSTPQSNFS